MKLERRGYQMYLVHQVRKALDEGVSLIIELDAGLGKRVLQYLIARHFPDKRILIITPTQASLADTVATFEELYRSEGLNSDEIGYIQAGVPRRVKEEILRTKRVVISTPISLARVLARNPDLARGFDIVIVNEVDKVVRRVAVTEEVDDARAASSPIITTAAEFKPPPRVKKRLRLVHPWSELVKYIPDTAIVIGMSGTLRDEHVIHTGEKVVLKPEIETLLETLFRGRKTRIITMDELLQRTDVWRYIHRNLTIIVPLPVEDDAVRAVDEALSREMEAVAEKIASRRGEFEYSTLVERAVPLLPDTPTKWKFLRLALVRRFVVSTYPEHYSRFLRTPFIRKLIETHTGKRLEEVIPRESKKIEKVVELAKDWVARGSKVAILSSFARVAERVASVLRKHELKVYVLTGATPDKRGVLEEFKKSGDVLCFSPVGERDIDLPVDVMIVYDVIRTTKTMYQRLKRGRRSYVLILYYAGTHEEAKVRSLLTEMRRQYPWSIRVYWE